MSKLFISLLYLYCAGNDEQCVESTLSRNVHIRIENIEYYRNYEYIECKKVNGNDKFSGCENLKTIGCIFFMKDDTNYKSGYACPE